MDLIILVADTDMQSAMEGLLGRVPSLGIRPIQYRIFVHPQHDPACRTAAHDFLRPFINKFDHAVVVLDFEGCGARENQTPVDVETEIEEQLFRNGWTNRAIAVVIGPELEVWVWSSSPHVEKDTWLERKTAYPQRMA